MDIANYPATPRLINRFSLGADPEFVFHTQKNIYVYAENLGMTTMHAFGCDMSGRQAEIRACPSKFALEVVASIVDSLRWMAYAHQDSVLPLKWVSTAYNGQDGCGGHIHFGRRRPNRRHEVEVLDTVTKTLLEIGVLNKVSFRQRVQDRHGYGLYGDIRPQSHGFEYRTLPTELSNPWLTYFVMVVCKLSIYHGKQWLSSSSALSLEKILDLFRHYADRDDDAAIALKALRIWGLPKDSSEDFKPYWGIRTETEVVCEGDDSRFFPSIITPESQTCEELFNYLTKGEPLPKRTPKPTWKPFHLPKGFSRLNVTKHTLGHLPDVGMNLVSKNIEVLLAVADEFTIYEGPVALPRRQIKEAFREFAPQIRFITGENYGSIQIFIPRNFNKSLEQCKKLHKALCDTSLFPVCKAWDIDKVDWSMWDKASPTLSKPMLGKLVANIAPKPKEVVAPESKKKKPLYYYEIYNEEGF